MNKKNKTVLVGLVIICAISIGYIFFLNKPRLNTESKEQLQASIQSINSSLSDSDQTKFAQALKILLFSNFSFADIMTGKTSAENVGTEALKKYNGQTASQIVDAAEAFKAERQKEQRKQAKQEVLEIEEKLRVNKTGQDTLRMVEVIKSRFYKDGSGYIERPAVQIKVKNGTSNSISEMDFRATVASPNRSVPWITDDFSYKISGGLEPGEVADWHLRPNKSVWDATVPADAILTIQVVGIKDANGKAVASSIEDERNLQERLNKLKTIEIDN